MIRLNLWFWFWEKLNGEFNCDYNDCVLYIFFIIVGSNVIDDSFKGVNLIYIIFLIVNLCILVDLSNWMLKVLMVM